MEKNDSIRVVLDRLTKSAHFIPIKSNWIVEYLVELWIDYIVRYHGISKVFVPNRDSLFTLQSWKGFKQALGTKIKLSTAYNCQTDGQHERAVQILQDLLRSYTLDSVGDWEQHLPFIEFIYNNSYHANTGLKPFEALYGRPWRSPTCWLESLDIVIVGPLLLQEVAKKVNFIRQKIKIA